MINSIDLQNFKCFSDNKRFEFSSLNLLTGINGRGKSTVLQSILLIAQSFDTFKKIDFMVLNGDLIELGSFDDVRNSETPKSEDVKFQFCLKDGTEMSICFNENEQNDLEPTVKSFNLTRPNETDEDLLGFEPIFDKFNDQISSVNLEEELKDKISPLDLNRVIVAQQLSCVHYISADRLGPVKYVDKVSFNKNQFLNVGSKGARVINVLAKQDLPLVHEKLYLGRDSRSVQQQTEEWLAYVLDGAKIDVKGKESSSSVLWMLINNKSNSYKYKPTNVGFGYSYILPLIVSGLIAKSGEILIVENPEAHLHPRAQSRIAEFFALVASTGVQVFIESHSEHILNALRINTIKPNNELRNENLVIHYFDEGFDSKKLTMNEKGKIADWPVGFFDQQELDLAEIFKLSR